MRNAAETHSSSQQQPPTSGAGLEVCLLPGGRRPPGPGGWRWMADELRGDKQRDQLRNSKYFRRPPIKKTFEKKGFLEYFVKKE